MDKFVAMQAFVARRRGRHLHQGGRLAADAEADRDQLVQTLEAHLRRKLLNRTTRRVTVTPDGAAYYERALRVLGEMDELEASMSHAKANPSGRLRVDVGASVGRLMLIPALPDFHARYPDIQIDLGVSDRPVDLIGENVDCVLRGGEITDQSLVARRIGEFHIIAVRDARVPEAPRHAAHPRDLEATDTRRASTTSRTAPAARIPFDFTKDGERIEIQGRHVAVGQRLATPTWRRGWPAWASSRGRPSWCSGTSRAGALRAGAARLVRPSRSRCTWSIRRTAT